MMGKKFLVNVYDTSSNNRKTRLIVKAETMEEASIRAIDYVKRVSDRIKAKNGAE